MTPTDRKRLEAAAKKAGWDDGCPQPMMVGPGYYWNMVGFTGSKATASYCESITAQTPERVYAIAARLLKVKLGRKA